MITDIPEEHINIAKISGLTYSTSNVPVYRDIDWNVLTVGVDLVVMEGDLFLYRYVRNNYSKCYGISYDVTENVAIINFYNKLYV